MDKRDVIAQVSQKSGIAAELCGKVVKAFEKQSGEAIINKFKGIPNNRASILAGISEKTGLAAEDCEKALSALEEVVGAELSGKLTFRGGASA